MQDACRSQCVKLLKMKGNINARRIDGIVVALAPRRYSVTYRIAALQGPADTIGIYDLTEAPPIVIISPASPSLFTHVIALSAYIRDPVIRFYSASIPQRN